MKACAFVVDPEPSAGSVLVDLARRVGFEVVRIFSDVAAAEQQLQRTPLLYFLFTGSTMRSIQKTALAIRRADSPGVRFSPMIFFTQNPSLEVIRGCINMGFDDVITLPLAVGQTLERLDRQVEQTLVYYETDSYFGPDRRGRLAEDVGQGRRGVGGQHRRLQILRSPATGISVLSEELQVVIE